MSEAGSKRKGPPRRSAYAAAGVDIDAGARAKGRMAELAAAATRPEVIAGPARSGQGHVASWAFPMVSRSGRIYVLYSQHIGKFDTFFHTTGRMDGIYSDDNGKTWSRPQTVPMPRTNRDNPDPSYPANWICWKRKKLSGFWSLKPSFINELSPRMKLSTPFPKLFDEAEAG